MHVPDAFRETDTTTLHGLIHAQPFATLVTETDAGPEADHLPLLLDGDRGDMGVIHGHVARANPVWRHLLQRPRVLVIFEGPSAYISPSWYPSKMETGKVVPTWNYIVVHGRGIPTVFTDHEWLHSHVERMTREQEQHRSEPWAVADAPAEFTDRLLNAIVGFEIALDSLIGKWKLSQNRSASDRAGMRAGLAAEESEATGELLAWTRHNTP